MYYFCILIDFLKCSQQSYEIGVIILILQMRAIKHREVRLRTYVTQLGGAKIDP